MTLILRVNKIIIILWFLLSFAMVGIVGCTSYQKATTATTQTTAVSPSDEEVTTSSETREEEIKSAPSEEKAVTVSRTETTTETETKPQRHGLIGGLFYFIGEVVAFPFKVIGGIFDAIF